MNNAKPERAYSLLTLRPHSESSRAAFENFRRKDVVFMYHLTLIVFVFTGFGNLAMFILQEELRNRGRLLCAATLILPNLVGLAIRNKPIFLYFLPM